MTGIIRQYYGGNHFERNRTSNQCTMHLKLNVIFKYISIKLGEKDITYQGISGRRRIQKIMRHNCKQIHTCTYTHTSYKEMHFIFTLYLGGGII